LLEKSYFEVVIYFIQSEVLGICKEEIKTAEVCIGFYEEKQKSGNGRFKIRKGTTVRPFLAFLYAGYIEKSII
jgi:hypothetical protein